MVDRIILNMLGSYLQCALKCESIRLRANEVGIFCIYIIVYWTLARSHFPSSTTQIRGAMPSPGFSSVGMQLLSSLTQFIGSLHRLNTLNVCLSDLHSLLGITILTHCISRRLAGERLSSFSDLVNIPWPRLCLIFVLLDSWLFVFSSTRLFCVPPW